MSLAERIAQQKQRVSPPPPPPVIDDRPEWVKRRDEGKLPAKVLSAGTLP